MCRIDKAVNYFDQGFNCCQSILLSFGEEFGIDKASAIKLGGSFGGGMVRSGKTCGAVTGALMILGQKFGKSKLKDAVSEKLLYDKSLNFLNKFKSNNGTVICKNLLKLDISTPEGLKYAEDNGIFDEVCPKMVKNAAEILIILL